MFELHIVTDVRLTSLKAQGVTTRHRGCFGLTIAVQIGNPIETATLAAITAAEAIGKPGGEARTASRPSAAGRHQRRQWRRISSRR